MEKLTKAEEQLMQILWTMERGFMKEIYERYVEPKPAYTTISTVLNVLVKKGYIDYSLHGRSKQYFPLLSQKEYSKGMFKDMLKNYFDDSPQQFASFFASESDLSASDIEDVGQLFDQIREKYKK